MQIGCTFATSLATPEHIAFAEQFGYASAMVYDSPAIYADPWMSLARAADRTQRIRLGVAVITPRLRHLLANACAAATLAALAPGRVDIVVGSGFTSQLLLGKRPAPWSEVEAYVLGLRALLAGQQIEWDGAPVALLYGAAVGITPPGAVPIWVAAGGPRGCAAGDRVADGVIVTAHGQSLPTRVPWGLALHGTVLDDGEDIGSQRVVDAAGPAAAFQLHLGQRGRLAGTREAVDYAARLAAVDPATRHQWLHGGHLIEVLPQERSFITPDVIRQATRTGTRTEVRAFLDELATAGAEMVTFHPAGPAIPRELEAFAEAAAPWIASGRAGGSE